MTDKELQDIARAAIRKAGGDGTKLPKNWRNIAKAAIRKAKAAKAAKANQNQTNTGKKKKQNTTKNTNTSTNTGNGKNTGTNTGASGGNTGGNTGGKSTGKNTGGKNTGGKNTGGKNTGGNTGNNTGSNTGSKTTGTNVDTTGGNSDTGLLDLKNQNKIPAKDVFLRSFTVLFPDINSETGWLTDLYNAAIPYYKEGFTNEDIPDLLLSSENAPASYKSRFSGILELKKKMSAGQNISHIPTVAEFAQMSKEIKNEFNKYGLNSLGDDQTINQIIGNDVDFQEVQSRLSDAFFAIDNADQYLKQQLIDNFPTLSRSDLAKALLTGNVGAAELKKKIEVAGIKASAAEFGLQNQMSAEELYRMGVTRADARAGYNKTKQELFGLQSAQQQFGGDANIAAELEGENVLGKTSGEVKRLRSQARGQYQGTTGIRTTSLAKSKIGKI